MVRKRNYDSSTREKGSAATLDYPTTSTPDNRCLTKRQRCSQFVESSTCHETTTLLSCTHVREDNSEDANEIISETIMNRHSDDADLHQTITDMMCKMKYGKGMVSDQAEPSSKRTCLSADRSHQSLPSLDPEMYDNESSDEAQENSHNEDVHRVLSGGHLGSFGQASYQRNRAVII